MQGTVFDIQRFSLFDGPGVRTVVFLKGCPLRCLWCHNPEGLKGTPQIMFDPTKCIGCGACAEVCQKHVNDSGTHRFLRDLCKGCGKCAEECYGGGQMAQITTANLDDLLDAKVHPERHGDLIVRVGGFSSQFVILRETVQDEIISRYAQA